MKAKNNKPKGGPATNRRLGRKTELNQTEPASRGGAQAISFFI
jgi:hypothetical protein